MTNDLGGRLGVRVALGSKGALAGFRRDGGRRGRTVSGGAGGYTCARRPFSVSVSQHADDGPRGEGSTTWPTHSGQPHRRPVDEAPPELLRTAQSCRPPEPGAAWHDLPGPAEGHCTLDPVKVTLTCPGITATGAIAEEGIPVRVLTAYLAMRNNVDSAFQRLPEPVFPPQHRYQRLVRGGTERVRIAEAAHRVAAARVTVTPPGTPVLMPGESTGTADGPLLRYPTALEIFDRTFPGFPQRDPRRDGRGGHR
ncbi:hypothetical protein [Streptomyces sp. NPDC046759]|uniref:Orn/Lys/Arg family decarboxylase n=1 Tax=Streptomyces sp. NPDC046759 TaxID=3155019 RepID=UPI003405EA65